MDMAGGEQLDERCGMEPLVDAVAGGDDAVLDAGQTLLRGRAQSKPAERIGKGGHEESKPAK